MNITDLALMPGFNPKVPNGASSLSVGLVWWDESVNQYGAKNKATCRRHGAMLCVAVQDTGRIWRCPTCNEGLYEWL